MKKFLTLTTAIFVLFSSTANAEGIKTDAAAKPKFPVVGESAPEITAKDIKGNDFSLAAQKGKLVVLEWTNPECPFVKKHYESNNMQTIQKKYTEAVNDKNEKQIVWVSILSSARGKQGYQSSDKEAQKTFEEQKSKADHIILDAEGIIGKTYGAKTTPHMFVVDKEGKLAYAGAIDSIASADSMDVEKAENYVAKALDELIAGKKITTPVTDPYGCSVKY
ncbi:MAG TPA: thioredoxin family protein [Alphaproteobacteria bacterium]|nr:thioredoxin family protein [Alphaproteobacteria bacterium]